jgi:hypothetical protein
MLETLRNRESKYKFSHNPKDMPPIILLKELLYWYSVSLIVYPDDV